jgi:hypothetical protein
MLPWYLTTFSGKKCLSRKVTVLFFDPLIEILLYSIVMFDSSDWGLEDAYRCVIGDSCRSKKDDNISVFSLPH